MKAFHFLREGLLAGEGDEPAWLVGEERTIDGPIALCERGYHSSPTLWQALAYAPGPIACLVEIPKKGTISESDKSVSPKRKLLVAVDIGRDLRLFAADCAERALHNFESRYPDDSRPRAAITAARQFANGEIDEQARSAAWSAARSAAWSAEIEWQKAEFERRFASVLVVAS